MSDATMEKEEEKVPLTTLVSASEVSEPHVQAWQFGSFQQEEQQRVQAIQSEVLDKLRKEAAPEIEKQAALIKKEAFEQAQKEGFEQGYQQGLSQGIAEGQAQALQEASEVLTVKVEMLDQLISAMEKPYQMIAAEVYESLVWLTTEVVKKVVDIELSSHPEHILHAIQQAIEVLPDDSVALTIELNSEDLEMVESYRAEYQKDWHLLPSDQVIKGACRVKHDASTVENNWQKQLIAVINQTLEIVHGDVKSVQTAVAASNVEVSETPDASQSVPDGA